MKGDVTHFSPREILLLTVPYPSSSSSPSEFLAFLVRRRMKKSPMTAPIKKTPPTAPPTMGLQRERKKRTQGKRVRSETREKEREDRMKSSPDRGRGRRRVQVRDGHGSSDED